MGLVPDSERPHMSENNLAHVPWILSLCSGAWARPPEPRARRAVLRIQGSRQDAKTAAGASRMSAAGLPLRPERAITRSEGPAQRKQRRKAS